MKDTYKQYARALYDLTRNRSGSELSKVLKSFVALLAKDQKLKWAPRILAEFEQYAKAADGVISLEVTSAQKLDADTLESIKKAFGKKVETTVKTDANLLGGMIVRNKNTILDASLRTQLQNLKSNLLA